LTRAPRAVGGFADELQGFGECRVGAVAKIAGSARVGGALVLHGSVDDQLSVGVSRPDLEQADPDRRHEADQRGGHARVRSVLSGQGRRVEAEFLAGEGALGAADLEHGTLDVAHQRVRRFGLSVDELGDRVTGLEG
jgi:hypothetical protein